MQQINDYSQQIYQAQDVSTLSGILAQLKAENNFRVLHNYRMSVFQQIRKLTELQANSEDLKFTENMILGELLPICILKEVVIPHARIIEEDGSSKYISSDAQKANLESHNARKLVADWLAFWVESGEDSLRTDVIRKACATALNEHLDVGEIKSACWLLGDIGLRSELVEETLWQVLERDDVASDVAGSILVDMGIPQDRRVAFTQKLRARLNKYPTRFNAYAAAKLRDTGLVEEILASFRRDSKYKWESGRLLQSDEVQDSDPMLKLSYRSMIADELWQDEQTQEKVWNSILDFCGKGEGHEGLYNLFFIGNLVSHCDSKNLVKDYFDHAQIVTDSFSQIEEETQKARSEASTDAPNSEQNEYIDSYIERLGIHFERVAGRIKDSIRPHQIASWEQISAGDVAQFLLLARRNTDTDTNFATSTVRAKEVCWQMLAFSGGLWNADDIKQALEGEVNGHCQDHIAKIISCFVQDTFLEFARDEITRPGNGLEGRRELQDSAADYFSFSRFQAAENIARSTANRGAFSALLSCNAVFHSVLQSTGNALIDVTHYLYDSGEVEIVNDLWKSSEKQNSTHHRELAVSALHSLALKEKLNISNWRRFLELAKDDSLDEFYRSLAIQAVGFFAPSQMTEAKDELIKFWQNVDQLGFELPNRAHETLARLNFWRDAGEETYLNKIGVEKVGGKWQWIPGITIESDRIVSLAFVYREFPDEFEVCVNQLLLKSIESSEEPVFFAPRNETLYALIFWLFAQSPEDEIQLSPVILDTIVESLKHPLASIPSYLFDALAVSAPKMLMSYEWGAKMSTANDSDNEYSGQTRLALSKAIGRAAEEGTPLTIEAIRTLKLLIRDEVFAVRRSAFRVLASHAPEDLEKLCGSILLSNNSYAYSMFERRIATEGAFWLKTDKASDLHIRARHDVEKPVRSLAQKSEKEARDRLWADGYWKQIQHLLEQEPNSSRFFLLGNALQSVGDDWHLHQLRNLDLSNSHPRLKCWRDYIEEKLKRSWDEKTKDWRLLGDSARSWNGIVQFTQGEMTVETEAWMWFQPRAGVKSQSLWGGEARIDHSNFSDTNNIQIEFADRKSFVSLSISRLSEKEAGSSWVHFRGEGNPPFEGGI